MHTAPALSGAHTWYPDVEYFRKFGDKQVLYLDDKEMTEKNFLFPSTERPRVPIELYDPQPEKFIRNMQINFGPQHPAAHGVLR
jgi:NADH dehydrogenase (ubiquinone) Fe-S protein 2